MVLGDIGQDGYFRPEIMDVVQLETADLTHVPLFWVFRHLPGEGIADIANQCAVQAAMAADMVGEGRGRALAVAARDADDAAVALVTPGQFDLADDRDAPGP